ncbi:MAG: DUF2794 domain-containing protein [Hyphomicrobium sp.]|nr:DUF2794 domain-containing protein [Hyphomicrobium sp.]
MSESEPITFSPHAAGNYRGHQTASGQASEAQRCITFTRPELTAILAVYGRKVACGEWRDYAIDLGRDKAVFSVFRRASEVPLFRIEKSPKLARKQGAYSVMAPAGLILKRGPDLVRVLSVLEGRPRLVGA